MGVPTMTVLVPRGTIRGGWASVSRASPPQKEDSLSTARFQPRRKDAAGDNLRPGVRVPDYQAADEDEDEEGSARIGFSNMRMIYHQANVHSLELVFNWHRTSIELMSTASS